VEWSGSGESVRQFRSMVIFNEALKRSNDVSASSIRLIISPGGIRENTFDDKGSFPIFIPWFPQENETTFQGLFKDF
jgi:hypothetical protein